MFHVFFSGVGLLFYLYIFWRMAATPWFRGRASRIILGAVLLFLWASYPLARTLGARHLHLMEAPMEFVGAMWIGVMLLLLCALLASEFVTVSAVALGWMLRRWGTDKSKRRLAFLAAPNAKPGPWIRMGAVVAAGALSFLALVQGMRPPVVVDYEVRLPGLAREHNGLTLVEVSDTHLGTMIGSRWMARIVRRVNEMKPDIVALVGDIVEGNAEEYPESMQAALRELRAPLGVWAVTGNHEFYGGIEGNVKWLEESGCQMLRDRWAEAAPGLVIAGIDDRHRRGDKSRGGNGVQSGDSTSQISPNVIAVKRALSGRPSSAATIFLAHTPRAEVADEASSAGAGLMLSGHTHAGQIWPFSYLVKAEFPLFTGRYDVNGMTAIVCRGTGTWGPRMRLWRPGEIIRIRLQCAE